MFAFKLKDTLSTTSPANAGDVLKMKNALSALGEYSTPSYGMTFYTDDAMFSGMRSVQRKNGLQVDGVARPGGETERTLSQLIGPRFQREETIRSSIPEATAQGIPTILPLESYGNDVNRGQATSGLGQNDLADPPILTMPDERRESILNDTPAIFKFGPGRENDDSSPFWEEPQRGRDAVAEFDEVIVEMAEKHSVNPDIVRSIMYMENARGHWYGASYLADDLGLSDTIMPMNIDPEIWGSLLGEGVDLSDTGQNIEAATILIGRISNRLDEPTAASIASVWNYLGRESKNDLGSYVQRVYDARLWEPQEGP